MRPVKRVPMMLSTTNEPPALPFDRDTRRHAGPCRRSIDLALREDADVARIRARAERRSGEDRPVEEREVRFSRMADLARRRHRALDRAADRDEIPKAIRGHLE